MKSRNSALRSLYGGTWTQNIYNFELESYATKKSSDGYT